MVPPEAVEDGAINGRRKTPQAFDPFLVSSGAGSD
jgi:hypothetical protein